MGLSDRRHTIEADGPERRQRQRNLPRDVSERVAPLIAVGRGIRQLSNAGAVEHDDDGSRERRWHARY